MKCKGLGMPRRVAGSPAWGKAGPGDPSPWVQMENSWQRQGRGGWGLCWTAGVLVMGKRREQGRALLSYRQKGAAQQGSWGHRDRSGILPAKLQEAECPYAQLGRLLARAPPSLRQRGPGATSSPFLWREYSGSCCTHKIKDLKDVRTDLGFYGNLRITHISQPS